VLTVVLVCGFQYQYVPDGSEEIGHAFPIAGLDPLGHGSKDSEVTRLKGDGQEGLLVKLAGGEYVDKDKKKKDARAVIEFQCDPDRSGLEGLASAANESSEEEEEEETRRRLVVRADEGDKDKDKDKDKEKTGPNDGSDPSRSLQFESFGPADDNSYVLKLKWRTRYACDNYVRDRKGDGSSHWGFFTWLIIMYVFPEPRHIERMLTWSSTVSSSASLPTLFSAPGSTTTATVPVVGTSSRTATPSATFRTFSTTGCEESSIRSKGAGREAVTARFEGLDLWHFCGSWHWHICYILSDCDFHIRHVRSFADLRNTGSMGIDRTV
jgi:hypothetical protein